MARTFKMIAYTNHGIKEVESFEGYEEFELVDEDTFFNIIKRKNDFDFFICAELSEQMSLQLILPEYYFKK